MSSDQQFWPEIDTRKIWHPYSQHGLNLPILPVESASGAYLNLTDGRKILDAVSSWWVNIHGHCDSRIAGAIAKQAQKLEHVIFSGFTHEPAVQLASRLLDYPAIRNAEFSKIFYSDNGSTAVEVAMKMAYQIPLNLGKRLRPKFLALEGAYHGDTVGAMAVGDPSGFHGKFRPLMPEVDFVRPGDLDQLRALLEMNLESYAAFIFEPILQGAGGMRIYSASYLKEAVELCRSQGMMIIADEVFTGFYRTGKCFAFEYAEIQPDLVCLSKGITGGFLPLAATLATDRVFEAFLTNSMNEAFLHGHSYTANPIALAAAVESWDILHSPECQNRIQTIVAVTAECIGKLKENPKVKDARCIGTIGAIQGYEGFGYFSTKPGQVLQRALEKGVLIRPLGDVLYSVPPYCCTEDEIRRIYQVIEELI